MLTPERAIAVIHKRFGVHAGTRALHAKGTVCTGSFTPSAEAASLTRAAHMQGDPVRVTSRVSNGSGDPGVPDYAPDVRGLAVAFHLPDGSATDIVAQSAPRFPVSTPEDFMRLVELGKPSPANALRLPLFLATHPRVLRTSRENIPALRPPVSYASIRYFGVHAYRWIAADGSDRFVRYTWVPEDEQPRISPTEGRKRGRDYLQEEIGRRLDAGPARFSLHLQVADARDRVDDPSHYWPEDRRVVDAGTLELDGRVDEPNLLIFDPMRLTDGIEASDDPVLAFRPPAYSASISLRSQV